MQKKNHTKNYVTPPHEKREFSPSPARPCLELTLVNSSL